jgi:hypothetical protein
MTQKNLRQPGGPDRARNECPQAPIAKERRTVLSVDEMKQRNLEGPPRRWHYVVGCLFVLFLAVVMGGLLIYGIAKFVEGLL